MLSLYNTLTKHKEEFHPKDSKHVTVYTCGPTVYNFAHIGNLRTFIFYDVLTRVLELEFGQGAVHRVMNITDVGHLTSDADEGEDKMDKAVAREGGSVEDIITYYTNAFLSDAKKLNIRIPKDLPRASHYIPQQIELIKKLFNHGFAYDTPEAIYFDTSQFADYGKLSGQRQEEKEIGAREEVVTETSKRNPADFALWFKRVGRFAHHIQHWPSPWGDGFPGWHLECSALIKTLLGQPIDIHAGGVDHIGTHHTNEIAQSEAAYGVPLARVWLHAEHLLVDNKKMAKSQGNFYTLADIEKRGINPLAFRYLILTTHYRSKLNFTWESLEYANTTLEKLYMTYLSLYAKKTDDADVSMSKQVLSYKQRFLDILNDDLNTLRALAFTLMMLADDNVSVAEKIYLVGFFDSIFGLGLEDYRIQNMKPLPPEVQKLVHERGILRNQVDFTRNKELQKNSDTLREAIECLGYTVMDTKEGTLVLRRYGQKT